jgi:hypothetical protein
MEDIVVKRMRGRIVVCNSLDPAVYAPARTCEVSEKIACLPDV